MFPISSAEPCSAVLRSFDAMDVLHVSSELGQPAPASAVAAAPIASIRAALDRNLDVAEALEHTAGADGLQAQHYRSAADRLSAILDYIG